MADTVKKAMDHRCGIVRRTEAMKLRKTLKTL